MDNSKKASRSEYVSPYLQAPLRSLDEVLDHREGASVERSRIAHQRGGQVEQPRRDRERERDVRAKPAA